MHSRIFQISMTPIKEIDYVTEADYNYEHWFCREIADYVVESDDRNADIEWLKNCTKGLLFDKDKYGNYFIVKSKEDYFASRFEVFKNVLDTMKECTIEDFASGILGMWSLSNAYEEKFGFYVDADGEVITFDSFVRKCAVNEKYYIGNTLDYHC